MLHKGIGVRDMGIYYMPRAQAFFGLPPTLIEWDSIRCEAGLDIFIVGGEIYT